MASIHDSLSQIIAQFASSADKEVIEYCVSVCDELVSSGAPRDEWCASLGPILGGFSSSDANADELGGVVYDEVRNKHSNLLTAKPSPAPPPAAKPKQAKQAKQPTNPTPTPAPAPTTQPTASTPKASEFVPPASNPTTTTTPTNHTWQQDIAALDDLTLQDLDDVDGLSSEWLETIRTATSWGGRARGGRGLQAPENYGDTIAVHNITLGFASHGGGLLLEGAELKLVRGRRYGLVGNNGVGKSVLLRRLAAGRMPGFPRHLRAMYIGQELPGSSQTALEAVLSPPPQPALEMQLRLMQEELKKTNSDERRGNLLSEIELVKTLLEEAVGTPDEKEAKRVLTAVGFTKEMRSRQISELSGGWRMRVALAAAMYRPPTLLMVDEPTNHLDLRAVAWLEDWMLSWPEDSVLVVVSHDRAFLSRVSTDIIEFSGGRLEQWAMGYDEYVETKMQKAQAYANSAAALSRQRDQVQKSIQNLQSQSKNDQKKSTQKVSKEKKLERMGFDKTADGKKWKISTMGYRQGSLDAEFLHARGSGKSVDNSKFLEYSGGEQPFRAKFGDPGPLGTSDAVPVMQLREVSFSFPGSRTNILDNITLSVRMGDKVAIVGENGQGKSTLMSILASKLNPTRGERLINNHARVGHFSQHSSNNLPPSMSPMSYLRHVFPAASESQLRSHLGSYKLGGDVMCRPMGLLSGGQRARVVFAAETFTSPHILLLDEPTNHLDIQTIAFLGDALNEFTGVVLLVTHNRDLISAIENIHLWEVSQGHVTPFPGTVDDYKAARSQAGARDMRSLSHNVPASVTRTNVAQGSFL
eukprot:c11500_g1_i1.p1 GENE.c11500_g1_i1~~c11500_g1_i1.p1  ORF type:complete len:811 (+),score=231.90 c11500_g1_i1:117-2549(+)